MKQGEEITLGSVIRDIELRDLKDSSREHSPLEKAKDAIEIDTTKLSIDAQVNEIVSLIETNN
jgi:cytidylate kinase